MLILFIISYVTSIINIMNTTTELITDFLAEKNIAVAGISLSRTTPASHIFKKLKTAGYNVSAVNSKGGTFEGGTCYASLQDIAPLPGGVVIVTRPEITGQIIDDCIRLGINRIWIHNMTGISDVDGTGGSSISADGVKRAREAGLFVISGSCPMQFVPPVDLFHRCVRWYCEKTGKLESTHNSL
jgi:uncharacterized protein